MVAKVTLEYDLPPLNFFPSEAIPYGGPDMTEWYPIKFNTFVSQSNIPGLTPGTYIGEPTKTKWGGSETLFEDINLSEKGRYMFIASVPYRNFGGGDANHCVRISFNSGSSFIYGIPVYGETVGIARGVIDINSATSFQVQRISKVVGAGDGSFLAKDGGITGDTTDRAQTFAECVIRKVA
jgi:hypothetical protein